MEHEPLSSPNAEQSRALFPDPEFGLLGFAEIFCQVFRCSWSRCLNWLKRIPSKSVRLGFDAEEPPQHSQLTVHVAVIFPLDFQEREAGPNIPPHVDNGVTMPATRSRLTFARPHPDRKYFAKHSRLEAVPFLLEILDRKAAWQSEKKNADVIFSRELDKQPDVFLSDKLRPVAAAVALILS
jgi:hypothetical protein